MFPLRISEVVVCYGDVLFDFNVAQRLSLEGVCYLRRGGPTVQDEIVEREDALIVGIQCFVLQTPNAGLNGQYRLNFVLVAGCDMFGVLVAIRLKSGCFCVAVAAVDVDAPVSVLYGGGCML